MYAYKELKKELENVEEVAFLFNKPLFTGKCSKEILESERNIFGSEFEAKIKSDLLQKKIARECADWIQKKVRFKSNVSGEIMPGFVAINGKAYTGIQDFTKVDLGAATGNNAYYPIVKTDETENSRYFLKMFDEITPDTAGVEYCREKLEGFLDKEYADGLKTIIDSVNAVKTAEFKIAFDPTLVRGMSYYTGPIFEIAMDEYGGSVGGGGRYDEMIGKFTGNQTCACGFSIGFERIVMLLLERDYQIPGAQKKKAYLIEKNMPAEGMQKIIQQATKERSEGTAINIAVMKKNKKFQKEQLASEGYTEIEEFFVDKM